MSPRSPASCRPRRREKARAGVAAGLAAVAALTAAGCGGDDAPPVAKLTAAQVAERLATTPPGLTPAARALESRAGELDVPPAKDAAPAALAAQVKALRGTPVVVNVWADWCAPCKKEMPIFQRVALEQRGKVAFLGVASQATRAASASYLREQIALPYPSLVDEDGKVIDDTGVDGLPKTIFYDRTGKRFVHNGPYTSQADLLTDIARYAS